MATANSDAEKLRYYKAAARNARKINRSLQSRSEKLETWLDRHVNRKARIDPEKAQGSYALFQGIQAQYNALEKALADLVNVASM